MLFTTQPRTRILLAVGWFLVTTILLAMPGDALPKTKLVNIPNFDKLVHVGLFAVLTWLAFRALPKPTSWKITAITLTAILYGIIMEYVQLYLVANRSFDGIDIIADATGAIAAALLWHPVTRKRS